MARICLEAEDFIDYGDLFKRIMETAPMPMSPLESVASSAVTTAFSINAVLILILTRGGTTAKLVSKYRPTKASDNTESTDETKELSLQHTKAKKLCKSGDFIVALHRIDDASVIKIVN
ncbi:hypothetical protein EZV62_013901 [Acer yangbiense]|uniref:Pyruvate kinase C-terminal domain-containing protein n=1 Tax=Acer yangbiense TaxID=1000413 RepID=A0A5C7HRA6_9ROSI|nr:hypothetical protein EZV62_013901 [Acer yangbiense]